MRCAVTADREPGRNDEWTPQGVLLRSMADQVLAFSVGIVSRDPSGNGHVAGSGTLVRVGQHRGMLTAAHVLAPLSGQRDLALVVGLRDGGFEHRELQFDACYPLTIAYGGPSSSGPDLAFLLFPPDFAASLEGVAAFYNLGIDPRRTQMVFGRFAYPPHTYPAAHWFLLNGCADEFTRNSAPQHGAERVKEFATTSFMGRVRVEPIDGPFDYWRFLPSYAGPVLFPPTSFGGCSGGGLWEVSLLRDGLSLALGPLLRGVAFWESDEVDDRRWIRCHGPRSLYWRALDAIRREWP